MDSRPSTSTGKSEMPDTRRAYITRLAPFAKKKHLLKLFAPYQPEPNGTVVLRQRGGNAAFVTFPSPEILNDVLRAANTRPFYLHKRPIIVLRADSWHNPHVPALESPIPVEAPTNAVVYEFTDPLPGYVPPEIPETILNLECIIHIASFLNLRGITIRQSTLWEIVETHRNLEELHLGKSVHLIDEQLSLLLSRNPSIKTLSFTKSNLTGEGFIWANNVESFSLESCKNLDPDMFVEMMGHQRKLQKLFITNCDSLLGGRVLRVMVENSELHSTLTHVTLSGINLVLPDQTLDVVAPASEEGAWLYLDDGPWETATSLPAAFANVVTLRVRFCGWVNYIFVQELGFEMKRVEFLDLSGCSNIRGLFSLEPLETLKSISVLWLNNLHPSVGGNFLMRMLNLTEFQCRQSGGFSDEDICGLLLHCSKIQLLDLESCYQITRTVVERAIDSRHLRRAHLTMYVGRTSVPFMHVREYMGTVMVNFDPTAPTLGEMTEPIDPNRFQGFHRIQNQDP